MTSSQPRLMCFRLLSKRFDYPPNSFRNVFISKAELQLSDLHSTDC
ncbi:MAG: hypothetical protein ACTS53_00550 [Candidatus Hodgkinia cicadicola]